MKLVIAGLNLRIKENIKHEYKIVNQVHITHKFTPWARPQGFMRDNFWYVSISHMSA